MLILVAALAFSPEKAASPPADKDPIVCRRDSSPAVGTHMRPQKKCMPKSDWEYVEKQTQDELNTLRDRHLSPGTTGYRVPKPQ